MARFARAVKESRHGLPGARASRDVAFALVLALACSACALPPVLQAWNPMPLAPDTPDQGWKLDAPPSELRAPADAWKASAPTVPQPDRTYDLPAVVDVALLNNPETRRSWEDARTAAARYGRALSAYYPQVTSAVSGGPSRFLFQNDPQPLTIKQNSLEPQVELTWTLLDFGRRQSSAELARQQLLAANLTFNRKMQDVIFAVQRAYFALDAAKGMVHAAEQNLALSRSVLDASEERLKLGLATRPDVLLARQVDAKAVYDLENARVLVSDAQATLAMALGIPANAPLEIASLESQPLPKKLAVAVDDVIDAAIQQRPDLAARMAQIRAGEAAVDKAKADLFPKFGFDGTYGQDIWSYRINGAPRDTANGPDYAYLFNLQWDVFKGFDRLNAVREAEAERDAARADLASAQLETTAAVWRAYFNYRAARKKYEYAESLLKASDDAYQANREGYGLGLNTIVELLTGERDLASARFLVVQTRAELLTRSAELAWAAGAMEVGAVR